MTKGKIVFVGNFWEYFAISIALMLLTIVTLGLALPYWAYWSFKYFFNRMEIEIYDSGNVHVTLPSSGDQGPRAPSF